MSYRIVFCGTPEFAVPSLKSLVVDPEFSVEMVFTQPDRPSGRGKKLKPSPIKSLALEQGLTVETPEKVSKSEWMDFLEKEKFDLCVVVAFGQILSQDFLDSFKFGCVNVHSSLLPRWRGAAPMQRAIMAGDAETGVSLQQVVKKLDAGDVIAERKVSLPLDLGAKELYEKLSHLGAELLKEDLKKFLLGQITPREQDENSVTHAAKILKQEAGVDWSLSGLEVHNKIRGLNMGGPYAQGTFKEKTLKLHQSAFVEGEHDLDPGTIAEVNKDSFRVACGKGLVELFVVQPENKARMSAADFIRGYHLNAGEKFD